MLPSAEWGAMKLEGIHHITAITADAPGNVEFYAGTLGLRLVKKTVNQDDPTVYHLFYADEAASAGADITFFEYPGARRGRPGAGMVHRVVFRVGSEEALGTAAALALLKELAPVITALLFAGRAGTSLTSEIGLMRATDQLTAMKMMAVDPLRYVAAPRFLGGVVAMPLLGAVFSIIGLSARSSWASS